MTVGTEHGSVDTDYVEICQYRDDDKSQAHKRWYALDSVSDDDTGAKAAFELGRKFANGVVKLERAEMLIAEYRDEQSGTTDPATLEVLVNAYARGMYDVLAHGQ